MALFKKSKYIILVTSLAMMLTFTACGKKQTATNQPKQTESVNTQKTNEKENKNNSNASVNQGETKNPEKEEKPIVTVEELPYTLEIQKPDSAGTIYGLMTYTNNSKHPITGIEFTFHLKKKNDTTFYITYNTVLPGETSPTFEAFAEANKDDMELTKVSIETKDDNGKKVYIDYDVKLNEYEVTVMND